MSRSWGLRLLIRLVKVCLFVVMSFFGIFMSAKLVEIIREASDLATIRSSYQQLVYASLDNRDTVSGVNPDEVPGRIVLKYDREFGETYQTVVAVTQCKSLWQNSKGWDLTVLDSETNDPAQARYYRLTYVPSSQAMLCAYQGVRESDSTIDRALVFIFSTYARLFQI